jgi:hypothetical protein
MNLTEHKTRKGEVFMKRVMIAVTLLMICFMLPTTVKAHEKAQTPDMSNMNHIFLGWVDIGQDAYRYLGYETREDWDKVIKDENIGFQEDFQTKMHGRTVVVAKDSKDENTLGNDLYIKFTDATVDKGYRLHLTVHLIDLKTNTEIGSIPNLVLNSHLCSLTGCISKDLGVVTEKLLVMITGSKK